MSLAWSRDVTTLLLLRHRSLLLVDCAGELAAHDDVQRFVLAMVVGPVSLITLMSRAVFIDGCDGRLLICLAPIVFGFFARLGNPFLLVSLNSILAASLN